MARIAGLEEIEYHCVLSERALWDEVPGVIVNHSKSNAARRTGNERASCVEAAERLGRQV